MQSKFLAPAVAIGVWALTCLVNAEYHTVRIDSLDNKDAVANSINDQEVVVGRWVNSSNSVYGFSYRRDPFLGVTFKSFPPPAGRSSTFRSVANTNRGVGWAHNLFEQKRPGYVNNVLSNSSWTILGTGGHPEGTLFDSDGGERLVGEVVFSDGTSHGAVWQSDAAGSNPVFLTSRPGVFLALNGAASRRAVGYRLNSSGNGNEAIWADTLGSISVRSLPMSGFTESRAEGINDSNFVVGQIKDSAGRWYPCVWTWTGSYNPPLILPTPTNGSTTSQFAVATGIANGRPELSGHGVIIGSALNASGVKVACRWQFFFPYQFEDMNATTRGYSDDQRVFSEARGINNLAVGVWSNQGIGESIVGRGRPIEGSEIFEAVFASDMVDETLPPTTAFNPRTANVDVVNVPGGNRTIGSVERLEPSGYTTADWIIEPGVTPNRQITGLLRYCPPGQSLSVQPFHVMESTQVRFLLRPNWAGIFIRLIPDTVQIESPGGPNDVFGVPRSPAVTVEISDVWNIAGADVGIVVDHSEALSEIMTLRIQQNRTSIDSKSATRAAYPGSSSLRARLMRVHPFGPVSARSVEFQVTYPSGQTATAVGVTDSNGIAQTSVQIPANAGIGKANVSITFAGDSRDIIPGNAPVTSSMTFPVAGDTSKGRRP